MELKQKVINLMQVRKTLQRLIANVLDHFETIDILINNAGITKDNLLLRLSDEDFDNVLNTNLKSVFQLTKLVMRPMMKQKGGSIINISSIVGLTGNPGTIELCCFKSWSNCI